MKHNYFLVAFIITSLQSLQLVAAEPTQLVQLYSGKEKGPMNSDWFYSGIPPHDKAIALFEKRKWKEAEDEFDKVKDKIPNSPMHKMSREEIMYTKHMCRMQKAICRAARNKSSEDWASFDFLIGIQKQKQISYEMIASGKLRDSRVLVREDLVGIGDDSHFIEVINILQQRTGCHAIFYIRDFLKPTFQCVADAYGFELIGTSEPQPETDYITHIIGLLGHLKLLPSQTAPARVVLTTPERAMVAVAQQIDPLIAAGKRPVMVYRGDKRKATFIGGKECPHDPAKHGRHLDSIAFEILLRNHPDAVLIDCGDEERGSAVLVAKDQLDRYVKLASEEQAFDTTIALAALMNDRPTMVGFGADTGGTNVFIRALLKRVQKERMALIIPDASEENGDYEWRMEGFKKGKKYTQMISECTVYKCDKSEDQAQVIEEAYQDMTTTIQVAPLHTYIQ